MKKIFTFLCLIITVITVFSQTNITFQKNALKSGDSVVSYEFIYTDPGAEGPNQIWDFSNIKFIANEQTSYVLSTPMSDLKDVGSYNVISNEFGNEFYYNINEDIFESKGYVSNDVSLVYSNPITKMKYPFVYGDRFTDSFSGHALYQQYTQVTFEGQYAVIADAFGTLILPDRTIKNTLRVKVVKTATEYNPCSVIESIQTSYYWYADGYRYPILILNYKEVQKSFQETKIIETAYYNPQKLSTENNCVTGTDEYFNNEFAVNSYPNPFEEKVNCTYFLRQPMSVTIELFDVSGKLSVFVLNNQMQQEGIHTFDVDAVTYSLVPGVYYIRYTFDKKVLVHKVVKV